MYIHKGAFPKISIVTPSFNQGMFLEQTICSVLDQKYPNLEYIIIDGGSKDNSIEIIKRYEKYLTYWVSEKDKGHSNALNKGFAKTTGEIMAWINSDDMYLPNSFLTVARIFNELPEVKWLTGKHGNWNKDGRFLGDVVVYRNMYDFICGKYKEGWIQQESTFWKRELWTKSGAYLDENIKLSVDTELWTRFFLFEELWHVNTVLAGYRIHNTNRAKLYRNKLLEETDEVVKIMIDNLTDSGKLIEKFNRVLGGDIQLENSEDFYYNVINVNSDKVEKGKVSYFLWNALNSKEFAAKLYNEYCTNNGCINTFKYHEIRRKIYKLYKKLSSK